MTDVIKQTAHDLGFIAIGFSRPATPLYMDRFMTWVGRGRHAGMDWMSRHLEIRRDPLKLLAGCKTIISLAYPYPDIKPATPDGFYVARYAQPTTEDYHFRLKSICSRIRDLLQERYPGSKSRICVDSAPLMERSFACTAGIGFFGKNNMLVIPGYGSYFYLAEVLTTAFLGFDPVRPLENQCGTCTRCIDSCPTGALQAAFDFDAARCLSYLTIEHKGEVDGAAGRSMKECFLGCDVCQEVCPFNRGETAAQVQLPLTGHILGMEEEEFKARYGRTALARPGLQKIKANISAVIRNTVTRNR